jgi:antitoxin VapB
MALKIETDEVERLAAELVDLTGLTSAEVVHQALQSHLERLRRGPRRTRMSRRIEEIALRCSALPVLDSSDPDATLGYDDDGLPG